MQPPPLSQVKQVASRVNYFSLRFLLPRLAVFALLLAGLAGTWYLWAHDPKDQRNFFFHCSFNEFTGLYCLGCGATRSGHALLHGRVLEALSQNAFFVGCVPLFAWLMLSRLLPWMLGKTNPKPMKPWVAKWIVWFPVVVVAFGVLRNLPWPPGPWLAPF